MNLSRWAVYLPPDALALLEALAISERAEHETAMPFAEACLHAQESADAAQVQVVVGWQLNDVSGDKEPGWATPASLAHVQLEPVALIYPLPRSAAPCKPRR